MFLSKESDGFEQGNIMAVSGWTIMILFIKQISVGTFFFYKFLSENNNTRKKSKNKLKVVIF